MQPFATGIGMFGHGLGIIVSDEELHGVGQREIERRTGLQSGIHLKLGKVLITSLHKGDQEDEDGE